MYISESDYEFLKRLKFKLLEMPNNGIASYYFNLHEIVSKLEQQRTNQIANDKTKSIKHN